MVARLARQAAQAAVFATDDEHGGAAEIEVPGGAVAVGFGAACSALAPEPSPGLMALGLSSDDARRVVRFSLAPGVDEASIDDAAERVAAIARRLKV